MYPMAYILTSNNTMGSPVSQLYTAVVYGWRLWES